MRRTKAYTNELQISNFIKEPENLKLLILAGTQLQYSEFKTIRLCVNLIKLDLSGNSLKEIPMPLSYLRGLKILFLHNNLIEEPEHLNITDCQAEYVTLFGNPIIFYRRLLISAMPKVRGIDYNMVCMWERANLIKEEKKLPGYTEVKWPIVYLEKGLENEVDYLNLLKAELFVLNNVYLRTMHSQRIEIFLKSIRHIAILDQELSMVYTERRKKSDMIRRVANKWLDFVSKRRLLREIMERRHKPYLLYDKIQYKKHLRSYYANMVIRRYVDSIRKRVMGRKFILRYIPYYCRIVKKYLEIMKNMNVPAKFYIKKSYIPVFYKIFLYMKRYFFKLKKYDICDNFDSLIRIDKKPARYLLILRQQYVNRNTRYHSLVASYMNTILIKNYFCRRSYNYDKKGHRLILKSEGKRQKLSYSQLYRYRYCYDKLYKLYNKYDRLIVMEVHRVDLYDYLRKLLKTFNSGGQLKILRNVAAYFQTEIPDPNHVEEHLQPYLNKILFKFPYDMILRVQSAVIIQKWWRSRMNLKKYPINLISEVNRQRAARKIQKWFRGNTLQHRLKFKREYRFYEKSLTSSKMYIQLYVYMNLPSMTDYLKRKYRKLDSPFMTDMHEQPFKNLYELLHRDTHCKFIHRSDRQWLKIDFGSVQYACRRIYLLTIHTYRFYFNGHSLRMFTLDEIVNYQMEDYEKKIRKSFRMFYDSQAYPKIDNKPVNNYMSVFIVEEGNQVLQTRTSKLPFHQNRRVKLNMFVLNNKKKPLKVECEFNVTMHNNIYLYNQLTQQFSIRKQQVKEVIQESYKIGSNNSIPDLYFPKPPIYRLRGLRLSSRGQSRSLRYSPAQSPDSKSNINSLRLISETVSIKRRLNQP